MVDWDYRAEAMGRMLARGMMTPLHFSVSAFAISAFAFRREHMQPEFNLLPVHFKQGLARYGNEVRGNVFGKNWLAGNRLPDDTAVS